MVSRQWFITWQAIILYLIIILGLIIISVSNDDSSNSNNYVQEIIKSVKEIIKEKEVINNNSTPNVMPDNYTTAVISDDQIESGTGGGSSSESDSVVLDMIQGTEINSLEELFNFENPIGNRVNINGIAFQVSGIDMYDYFFFTDDETIMSNPVLMLINGADFHITVYNSLTNIDPQSIITVSGIVINCEQDSEGIYCIRATSID